jgi:antitoxin component YwqK of YwqJK toxin-antitoxin module
MKFKIIIFHILLSLSLVSFSQVSPATNQTDEAGKKQGHWIMKEKNILIYEGFFKDGHPVGEFKRYNRDNTIKSLLIYSEDGKEADATIYHPNGFVASSGKYINQLKEGMWKFYSQYAEGYLISESYYSKNLMNGSSIQYFPEGKIAEKLNFVNDVKHGEWTQYYMNGVMSLRTNYIKGLLNGKFEVWFDNGKPQLTGQYKNNLKEGRWLVYKEDGTLKYEMDYIAGFTENKQMEIDESNFLDSLENNKEKISDPEKSGIIWK